MLTRESLDDYTIAVLDYINFCVDSVTTWRQIRVFPNQKPWMTHKVRLLIKAKDAASRSGDSSRYSTARAALRKGIKYAKLDYKRRIETHFETSTNSRQVWEGIRAITDYKGTTTPPLHSCDTLAEELNDFYAHFDRDNKDPVLAPFPSTGTAPVLSTHEVKLCFKKIDPRKAAGPDGVMGRVLKDCAPELAEVFTDIYNWSLSSAWVPACFKSAIIVPVPKQANVKCLNDYRPVALTPIPAKCLERMVMPHIKKVAPPTLDPFQFAYRQNRSTEDAIATVLHRLLEHLEHKNTDARLLFLTLAQLLTQSYLTNCVSNSTT